MRGGRWGLAGVMTAVATLLLAACSGFIEAEKTGMLPMTGDFPDLVQLGKNKIFTKAEDRMNYLGSRGRAIEQFGTTQIFVGDYTLGGKDNYLTMEAYQVDGEVGAAGIFYYYQGRVLGGGGKEVEVGAAGVLDTKNQNRNLYFYKGRHFFSFVYTGKEPVPDLIPLGNWLAAKITEKNWKPTGFRYLEGLEGVSQKYTRVSYGNALRMDFLPPAVMTLAMCAGKSAKVYICTFSEPKQAESVEGALVRYMRFDAKEYKSSSMKVGASNYTVHQAIEKDEGLTVFARGKSAFFIVTAADSVEKGKDLLRRLIEKEREESGFVKAGVDKAPARE